MRRTYRFPATSAEWDRTVRARRGPLRAFLSWAIERESVQSMRVQNRPDIARMANVLDAFVEAWWAAVVYSCFDSVEGTRAVASRFRKPVDPREAERLLSGVDLPRGAVRGHRTQPGYKGARSALVAACSQAPDFERIVLHGEGFHDRYVALRALHAPQWGRTTCFDLLVRTGQLGIGGRYAPQQAYLADSTGPRRGFNLVWGIEVTQMNASECERMLQVWVQRWHVFANQVGVKWTGRRYGPGDLENALCILQEPANAAHMARC